MATKEKVLGTLAAQSGPVTLKQLAQFLGEPQGNFYTQLTRYAKTGILVSKNFSDCERRVAFIQHTN